MSTTNIDEQKMQQINSSDTIKEFMEKCNNNFSIISQFGGGPEGKQGVEGSQGVPTKPKVPIHVWIEGEEYDVETKITDDKYKINVVHEDLTDTKYQDGHLIMLKNGHVYILEEDEEFNLKPNYIISLQSYNPDDVIDGKSAYIHIAYANSPDGHDGFITNKNLQENIGDGEKKYKYMGIYSSNKPYPSEEPTTYTWVRIMGDTGEKGDTGERGDTGRVLFYLGSFKDGTLTGNEVLGYLNEYRCDYYIDKNDVAWMRTGTSEEATGYIEGYVDGKKYNDNNWRESEKVGFLQAGAISADMINVQSLAADSAFIESIKATEINANKITTGTIYSNDKHSYFNLDNGDFVLGNDNGTALKYENGTLTIGGINDDVDVQSLMYLKEALVNDTNVTGGLISTSQIQLRDWTGKWLDDDETIKEYKVNAGIGGVKDDNILLWGGGTYEEAHNAASENNNFYMGKNKTGEKITTLIKKDGTSKLGIFNIEKNNTTIITDDGKVVIDDNDGISCYVGQEEIASIIVTPKSLKTLEDLREEGVEDGSSHTEDSNPFGDSISYSREGNPGGVTLMTNIKEYKVYCSAGGTIKVSGEIIVSNIECSHEGITVGNGVKDGMRCNIYDNDGNSVEISYDDYYRQYVAEIKKSGEYTIKLQACFTIDTQDLSFEYDDRVDIVVHLYMEQPIGYISTYKRANNQTILAYGGMFSYNGEDAYFYYRNGFGLDCKIGGVNFKITDKGILIDGLPDKSDGLDKGMLYNNNGTLMVAQ